MVYGIISVIKRWIIDSGLRLSIRFWKSAIRFEAPCLLFLLIQLLPYERLRSWHKTVMNKTDGDVESLLSSSLLPSIRRREEEKGRRLPVSASKVSIKTLKMAAKIQYFSNRVLPIAYIFLNYDNAEVKR